MAYQRDYREGCHLHPDDCLEIAPRYDWYIEQLLLHYKDFNNTDAFTDCLHDEWALEAWRTF